MPHSESHGGYDQQNGGRNCPKQFASRRFGCHDRCGNLVGWRGTPHQLNLSHKSITTTRHRFDESWMLRVIVQGTPQHLDVEGQVALFDKAILPEVLHQLVLLKQAAGVLHQELQRIEDFRRQRDRFFPTPQRPGRRVQTELSELVNAIRVGRNNGSHRILTDVS
jgi:hypothetical protein